MDFFKIEHALLAKHGINILDVTPEKDGHVFVFEYSWVDPDNKERLRWSKSALMLYTHGVDQAHITQIILTAVKSARKELERGE